MHFVSPRPVVRVASVLLLSYCVAGVAAPTASDIVAPGIDQVVITATRIEQSLTKIGDSVTLLQPAQVRASQKKTVADLLATTPGVAVSRNGGLGSTTTLRIRGAESEQTTVLIDGVKLNDPSAPGGGFNFGNLLTNDIARIEVLRGPQSTLWGSQAIGGVVNIVTPEPQGPLSAELSAEGGSRNTSSVTLSAQEGGERFGWRVGGSYLTTDGISSFDEDLGGRERDGYRNIGFNARGILRITADISAELRSTWSKGRVDFDGFPPPSFAFSDTREYGYTEELVSYAGLKAASFGGRLRNRIGFAYTDTDRNNFDPDAAVRKTFDAYGRNERWEYQGTVAITDDSIATFGLESERSQLSLASPSSFDPNPAPLARDVRIDSAYAQVQFAPIDAVSISAGGRYDDHETFGGNTTGHAAVAWSATDSTVLRASYGEGFKAPTLYQLFSPYGNESLQPESGHGWDAGIEQRLFKDVTVSAIYFNRATANMIDFVSCFGSSLPRCATQPLGFYENVQRTSVDGLELALTAVIGERLHFSVNYTGMDAENAVRGSANFGRQLARRPRETANGEITYDWNSGLSTTLAVQHAGRSFDNAANTSVLDGYTLVDLRAAYTFSPELQIYGRIENVSDEDYATASGYGSIGRGAFAGFRWSF